MICRGRTNIKTAGPSCGWTSFQKCFFWFGPRTKEHHPVGTDVIYQEYIKSKS